MKASSLALSALCLTTRMPLSSSPLPDIVAPLRAVNGSNPIISTSASSFSWPSSLRIVLRSVVPIFEARKASKSRCATNLASLEMSALLTVAASLAVKASAKPNSVSGAFFIVLVSIDATSTHGCKAIHAANSESYARHKKVPRYCRRMVMKPASRVGSMYRLTVLPVPLTLVLVSAPPGVRANLAGAEPPPFTAPLTCTE